MARRDWETAAPLLRQAIPSAPDSVALHYELAICATYLELGDEATREFQWVLEHAQAGSEEATVARTWLTQTRRPAAPEKTDERLGAERERNDAKAGNSGVRGVVEWAEAGQGVQPLDRKLLHLVGLKNTHTSGLRYSIRSDSSGRYGFEHVVAGPYKLTDTIAGRPLWRLKITVADAEEAVVDLGPNNSAKVRDDFPERGPS